MNWRTVQVGCASERGKKLKRGDMEGANSNTREREGEGVDNAADMSWLLGLSGELEHDLELQQVGGRQLHRWRGDGRGGQLVRW